MEMAVEGESDMPYTLPLPLPLVSAGIVVRLLLCAALVLVLWMDGMVVVALM